MIFLTPFTTNRVLLKPLEVSFAANEISFKANEVSFVHWLVPCSPKKRQKKCCAPQVAIFGRAELQFRRAIIIGGARLRRAETSSVRPVIVRDAVGKRRRAAPTFACAAQNEREAEDEFGFHGNSVAFSKISTCFTMPLR